MSSLWFYIENINVFRYIVGIAFVIIIWELVKGIVKATVNVACENKEDKK